MTITICKLQKGKTIPIQEVSSRAVAHAALRFLADKVRGDFFIQYSGDDAAELIKSAPRQAPTQHRWHP